MADGFAAALIRWQAAHGRHDLPWQGTRDPYRVWLSEIMLQQTQVATVIPYYERFLQRYPDVAALAAAPLSQVLQLWAGLGYYARARNLHACARAVVQEHGGRFPQTAEALARLPGVGPSTAAAIAAFCFGERAAILDANVKRVLARRHAVEEDLRGAAALQALWEQARRLLPAREHMPAYTQALMDLGATLCTRARPRCGECPVARGCRAHALARETDFPVRAAARARPERTAHFLLLVHRGAVLLEQRPERGIWGGLLAPPQFETVSELRAAARELAGAAPQALTQRVHGFTHYTLRFTPHFSEVGAERRPKAGAGRRWVSLRSVEGAALPAPVRTLLRELREGALG